MIRYHRFFTAALFCLCVSAAPRAAAQPVFSMRLSLRDALALAHMERGNPMNPRLAAAMAEIRVENGRRLQALSPPAPELLYHEEEIAAGASFGGGGQRIWQVSQEFDVPLLFGLHSRQYAASGRAAERRYEALRRELRAGVIRAYARASARMEQVKLLRDNARLMADFAEKAALRVRAGDAAPLEALRARSERELARIALGNGERELMAALGELYLLLDRIVTPGDGDTLDVLPLPAVDPASLADWDVESHPLLQEADWLRAAAEANSSRNWMLLLPTFRAAYFRQEIASTGRFWGAELSARVPLWFFLGQRGAIEERNALTAQAQEELTYRFAALHHRFNAARGSAAAALRSARSYADSLLPEAGEIRRSAERAFAAGGISYLEYIDAMKNANAILLGYHDAVAACYEALAELEYMTGTPLLAQ